MTATTLGLRGRAAIALFGVLSAFATGCGASTSDDDGVASLYVIPIKLSQLSGASFFDHPWPSDLRLEDGSPRFEGYYNPRLVPIIRDYVTSMKGVLDGFSPSAAGFLRFKGSIDPSSLPETPLDSLDPSASVQLIDIDPASAEHGQRRLVSLYWRGAEGVYWPKETLSFMPTVGFPLRPHTRYALVVTDAIRGASGEEVAVSPDLQMVLGTSPPDPRTQAAHDALAPAVAELTAAGIAPEHVVHLAVFKTNDPTEELFAFRDALRASFPPPKAIDSAWTLHKSTADYDEYYGSYGPSPNYQEGLVPFASFGDGGAFHYEGGAPTAVDSFDLRFSLTVPNPSKCPVPETGYPIVMYAHGSGGDYRSYVATGTGKEHAQRCMATMGVDQIFHGKRPGAPTSSDPSADYLLFFNFENIVAARTNGRQSALDEVQRARLFTEARMTVPASVAADGNEVAFDPTKLMFFGHSQGGLNGPLYVAADDSSRGGVFSGSGGLISIALIEKTEPSPSVAGLIKSVFLALKPDESDEVNVFHPIIALAQTIVDVVDPINYARYPVLEPRPGFAPKSYLMTEGINPDGVGDSYAPPHGIEALSIAVGLPASLPLQSAIVESAWGGPVAVTIPDDGLSGNLGDGRATGVLSQWPIAPGEDGHFVVFDNDEAKAQASKFLRNLAREDAGRVTPP